MTGGARPLDVIRLRPEDQRLESFSWLYGPSAGDRAVSLAGALATSEGVGRRPSARFVVKSEPSPVIALVGEFHEADSALVRALDWQVRDALERLRPVPYPEVEQACLVLAGRVRERLGDRVLSRSRLLGVPRGGLIVAGLLAYCLGIPADRVGEGPLAADGVRVVVDDCILSGARTRRWLTAHPGPPVVLAQLHSHPDLRTAVERDPRVLACVAAEDLHDHAPQQRGIDYEAWRRRWRDRSSDDYWTGHPDHVCYPWNEPDSVVWNAVTGAAEPGWHVVPPSWCVKNRFAPANAVQVCPPSPHLPDDVLWVELDGRVVVIGAGTTCELDGTGADFWRAVVASDDLEGAAIELRRLYDVETDVLAADVHQFVRQLCARGFLTGC